jgi:hypothetical protein
MQTSAPVLLSTLPLDAVGAEVGKVAAHDLLATLPEAIRRGRLGEYLSDEQAQAETGLNARQLRYLRERRRIEWTRVPGTRAVLYPTTALFRAIDAGRVSAREEAPA